VAIHGIFPENVRFVITHLCFFFNAICSKVIDPQQLDNLENEASTILCELEMYFPPSFFDIMIHLIVHLVREIRFCGPVFLRWMYPIEWYMKVLKGYTKNQYRPKVMQSYPARALDRRLEVDWAKDAREGPRVLMSLRVAFGPMG